MSHVEEIQNALEAIRSVEDEMLHLARAFDITGNRPLSDKIYLMCTNFGKHRRTISVAVNAWVRQDFERAENASRNMVRAAMAAAGTKPD